MANLATTHLSSAASSSSSASSSASTFYYSKYDVFINHRGPDVKNNFASHLHRRLLDRGLTVFFDKEELEEGHNISSQIVQAIRGASVQIAIFSPRYAQSSWCLNELVLMKNSGATILPVFYKVDPSVVRWTVKDGAYAEALRGLEQKTTYNSDTGEEKPRYDSDTIQSWRNALSYVADLSGFVLHGDEDDEGELLEKVIQSVLSKVPKTPLDVAKYATGLGEKLQDFEKSVLSQQQERERVEAKVVGIVGGGGVGKTTLAKEFFNRNRSSYNASSFLSEVREVAGRMSVNYLQSNLIRDLKHIDITVGHHQGIGILKKHLSLCHALIILDDVDHVSQLDAFLPIKDILSPHSLILVTSRDKHVLISSGVSEQSIYNLKGLDTPDSQKLFCSHAFHKPLPPPEFADLVDRFVMACDGLPLSLKVFGAQVCGENERAVWQEILNEFDKILPTTEIYDTLIISYNSLGPKVREIFLDIACFFLGEDGDKAMRIWGKVGVRNLQNRCLVEVDGNNLIKMHDHIRDMGRKIAEDGSLPRRLWHWTTNIIDDLLQPSSPLKTEVRGISMVSSSVDFFRFKDRDLSRQTSSRTSRKSLEFRHLFHNFNFPSMGKLQLVATEEDHLEDILRRVQQPHLIWLRWYRCSYFFLPDWIPMKNLRVLEVEGRRLNFLWPHQSQGAPLDLRELKIRAPLSEIPKSIGQLKYLERIVIWHQPSQATTLKKLPDEFCHLLSLKYLVLNGFSRMVSLPDSFGELINLQYIDMNGASSLQMLPNSFGNLNQLKHISLNGASSLQMLPNSFGNLNQLKHIFLNRASSLQMLPNSFGNLTRLEHVSLRFCENFTMSNRTLGNITTLEYLNLSNCKQVKELPPQVAHQWSLQTLELRGTELKELPLHLGDLKSLKVLTVSFSPQLKSLPDSIGLLTQLAHLNISRGGIEYLPQHLLKLNNLESLEVSNCPLREHPFNKKVEGERETFLSLEGERALNKLNSSNDRCMFGLKRLSLYETEIREVFFDDGVCPNLQELRFDYCYELSQIGGLCGLPKLRKLQISSCAKVEELRGLETLISLEMLDVYGCEKLQRVTGLRQLRKLRTIYVRHCREIQELLSVEHLTSLERLDVRGCEKPMRIQGLGQLTKLQELYVARCREIEELPGVEHLTSLRRLFIEGCESIQGLGQLTNLIVLYVSTCHEIRELPGVEHLTFLEILTIKCQKLHSIEGLGQLTKLTKLFVNECHEITELPGVEHLTSLEKLNVSGCQKLQSIQGLQKLTKLTKLGVNECHEITELPGVEHLTSLEELDVSGCRKLQSIQGLRKLTKLRRLTVRKCHEIKELPGVENLFSLEELNLSGCKKLQSIQGLQKLTKLRELSVRECYKIQELPGVEHLTLLEILDTCECPKLQWCEEVLEQLREQLKEGLKCEKQSERCSCLHFLQSLCCVLN